MKHFKYHGDIYQFTVDLFKHIGIPSYQASINLHAHDTGYPGLALPITEVTFRGIEDIKLENLICDLFQNMGFEQK